MNLTKRSKIIFIIVSVVLLVVILSTFAAIGDRLMLSIYNTILMHVSANKKSDVSIEESGLQRLSGIRQSLERAKDKMSQLITDTLGYGEDDRTARTRTKRNAIEYDSYNPSYFGKHYYLSTLITSVRHLSKSLSDFAEMLNQSGYANILSRYQKDIENYSQILHEVSGNNFTIDSETLSGLKVVQQLFYEDETDLMKIDTITVEQGVITKDVIEALEDICNRTQSVIDSSQESIHTDSISSTLPPSSSSTTPSPISTTVSSTAG